MDVGTLRHAIKKRYKKVKNWRLVAGEFGISAGMAWRIVNQDYEPREPKIRAALGLSSMALAPVCQSCGVVHVSRRCPGAGRLPGDLFSMSAADLRRAIEEREAVN